jgi:16S rRNA (cytidine1402-2'-O)-methyltransferase
VPGILYVVATPIGNLEDITYRAVRVLRDADIIACEDTRHTRKLLDHFGIGGQTVSYHEHNERSRSGKLLAALESGASVALVSDAGTPLVSDPGYRLVAAAVQAGVQVSPVPGPSAVLAALAASGLPTDTYFFAGFLPAKAGQRKRVLDSIAAMDCTVVFYEAPHRIIESLQDIGRSLPTRQVVVARELTKVHEEFLRGSPEELATALAARPVIRGEFTILAGKPETVTAVVGPAREAVEQYESQGLSRMDAIKAVARDRGVSKRQVYAEVEEQDRQ